LFKPSFIAGKELSFFIDMNKVQSFPHSKKAKQTPSKHQAESFLTVKQKFLLQNGLAEASSNPLALLITARPSYASSDFGLRKGWGKAWRGVPTSAGI